jgi:molybdate transport system substrate-binding protein
MVSTAPVWRAGISQATANAIECVINGQYFICKRGSTFKETMKTRQLIAALGLTALMAMNSHAAQLQVFAAASLYDALREIGPDYEKQTGMKAAFNFGASSLLARQIEEGAPADVFFSADEAKMDGLEKKGLILAGTRKSKLSNSLVIVVTADSALRIQSAQDLANPAIKRIALAEPKTVPAGIYAKAYLDSLKLWAAVQPKVVPTDNVRGALAAVESGNVEAGMVYKTDAAISKKVRVAYEAPAKETPKISYPMAVVKESKQVEEARRFLKHLDSKAAAQVFKKYGFIVLE